MACLNKGYGIDVGKGWCAKTLPLEGKEPRWVHTHFIANARKPAR